MIFFKLNTLLDLNLRRILLNKVEKFDWAPIAVGLLAVAFFSKGGIVS